MKLSENVWMVLNFSPFSIGPWVEGRMRCRRMVRPLDSPKKRRKFVLRPKSYGFRKCWPLASIRRFSE